MESQKLRQGIKHCTTSLLEMVRDHCWNRIPEEVVYIISEIKDREAAGWQNRIKSRRERDKLELMDFDTMMVNLEEIYPGIHDINLYVHRAVGKKTIVDVRYFPKARIGYDSKPSTPAMIHAKIGLPPYRSHDSQKFDVHWEFGGLRHQWRMFRWRQEMKKRNP